MKVDSSWTNSKGPSLPQSGAMHTDGAFKNCPVCSTIFMVPQRLHLKAPCRTMGLTGVALTTIPSIMTSLVICFDPSFLSCSLPRSCTILMMIFSIFSAYSAVFYAKLLVSTFSSMLQILFGSVEQLFRERLVKAVKFFKIN